MTRWEKVLMEQVYEGFYAQFDTPSKAVGSMMMGADHLVGDDYEVFFKTENGRVTAWIRNKFGAETGFLNVDASRRLQLAHARGMTIRAVLSFVAYSDLPDPGHYWGQVAVFCFAPRYADEMNGFIDRVAALMAEGVRPAIDLGSQAVSRILDDPGWIPADRVALPKKETGMAVLKDHQSASEKMIERGRAGNKGCYAVSIAFIVVVVVTIIAFVLHMTGMF